MATSDAFHENVEEQVSNDKQLHAKTSYDFFLISMTRMNAPSPNNDVIWSHPAHEVVSKVTVWEPIVIRYAFMVSNFKYQ